MVSLCGRERRSGLSRLGGIYWRGGEGFGMGRAESVVKGQERAFRRSREFLRDAAKLCDEKLKLVEAYLVGSRAKGRLSR